MAHKQIQLGSLSNVYKRLTEGGLAPNDPVKRLRQSHRCDDLSFMASQESIVQHARDTVPWHELVSVDHVYWVICCRKKSKPADRFGMLNEFLKILVDEPTIFHQYHQQIVLHMAQGHPPFHIDCATSCTGALVLATLKPNGDICPIQITDAHLSITNTAIVAAVYKSKAAMNCFETGNHCTNADTQF